MESANTQPVLSAHPAVLRAGLLSIGPCEPDLTGDQAAGLRKHPPVHRDSFHRALVAPAIAECVLLASVDAGIAQSGAPVHCAG